MSWKRFWNALTTERDEAFSKKDHNMWTDSEPFSKDEEKNWPTINLLSDKQEKLATEGS